MSDKNFKVKNGLSLQGTVDTVITSDNSGGILVNGLPNTGPTGATGPTGPAGPTGDTGDSFFLFTPKSGEMLRLNGGTSTAIASGFYTNQMLCGVFQIGVATTFNTISVNCTSFTSTGDFRMGVYNSDTNGLPGTLAFDAGVVSISSTGKKDISISETLEPGRYWAAGVAQSGSYSITNVNITNLYLLGYNGLITPDLVTSLSFPSQSSVTGALPNPTTAEAFGTPNVMYQIGLTAN